MPRAARVPSRRIPAPPPGVPEAPSTPAVSDPVQGQRWGWYLLSILVPLAGIFVGLFLYEAEDARTRRVGRNCLLVSFVLWVILPIMMAVSLLLLGFFSAISWMAQMGPAY